MAYKTLDRIWEEHYSILLLSISYKILFTKVWFAILSCQSLEFKQLQNTALLLGTFIENAYWSYYGTIVEIDHFD